MTYFLDDVFNLFSAEKG